MMSATNSAAYLFGLTGNAASMYIEKTGKTLGETMSEAAEGTIRDLCGIKGAIKYAANTAAVYELARVLGFIYDESEDLYYTRKDSLQYLFGFNDGIDLNEYMLGMNLNALSIEFQGEGGRYWRLELWNGQYGLGLATGAEIGLYERKTGESIDSEELKHYRSAEREDWLDMSFTLIDKKTGATIMERSSHDYERYYEEEYGEYAGKDWWITGYKLGEYIPKEDIRMEADIYFTKSQWESMSEDMLNAIKRIRGRGVSVESVDSELMITIGWN